MKIIYFSLGFNQFPVTYCELDQSWKHSACACAVFVCLFLAILSPRGMASTEKGIFRQYRITFIVSLRWYASFASFGLPLWSSNPIVMEECVPDHGIRILTTWLKKISTKMARKRAVKWAVQCDKSIVFRKQTDELGCLSPMWYEVVTDPVTNQTGLASPLYIVNGNSYWIFYTIFIHASNTYSSTIHFKCYICIYISSSLCQYWIGLCVGDNGNFHLKCKSLRRSSQCYLGCRWWWRHCLENG